MDTVGSVRIVKTVKKQTTRHFQTCLCRLVNQHFFKMRGRRTSSQDSTMNTQAMFSHPSAATKVHHSTVCEQGCLIEWWTNTNPDCLDEGSRWTIADLQRTWWTTCLSSESHVCVPLRAKSRLKLGELWWRIVSYVRNVYCYHVGRSAGFESATSMSSYC